MSDIDAAESADLVAAWRELLARHAATACALDRELGERFGLGMSEFEVLERLAETLGDCPGKLRVQELGEKVHLSQSALSRLIGRLEKGGLVERHMCTEDRRGVFVLLSDEGRQRYQEAKPLHRSVLRQTLVERQPSCG
ncbi:MarR family winged helix-turn-helix transcriptional regulator [Kitasatospora acidiphila]|uniref:MarR family winged helix-turn-helix transcriptional regulator n=1 Tax=Kitasatospora acidiphila TaxID=2567942 RepID=UPI001E612DAF|nr:MarR family transcriptional regulator [Kitasatospora acidiphila]